MWKGLERNVREMKKEVKGTEGIKERKGGEKELREDAEMKEKGKEG
jgi:hypothetical protein